MEQQQEQIILDNSFNIDEFIRQNTEKLALESLPDIDELLKNASDGKRGNGFVFTYNNFTHTPEELIELLTTLQNISFLRFQIEKAPETGTVHYQGYLHFSKRVYWGQVRRALIKAGLHRISHRNRIASPQKAADYCYKSKSKLTEPIYEWGVLDTEQGKRNDLTEIIERVKAGATNSELLEEFPVQCFQYQKHIESVRKTFFENKYEDKYRQMQIIYIYGSPRTGKTRFVLEKHGYKSVCRVSIKYDRWLFENYKGQPVIVFDEFNSQVEITEMNEYLEGYPQNYRCRNEDRVAMNDTVYIISNLPLSAQYTKIQIDKPMVYRAFCERINHIINWDNLKEREYFKQHGTALSKQQPPQLEVYGLRSLSDEEAGELPF